MASDLQIGNEASPARGWPRRAGLLAAFVVLLGCGYAGGWYVTAQYHLRHARAALDRQDWAEARRQADAGLAAWPRSPTAHLLAARAARRLEKLGEAYEHLEVCEQLQGGPSQATKVERALVRVHRGELADVEPFLRTCVVDNDPDADEILDILSAAYIIGYRVAEAQQCLDQLLARKPDHFNVLARRGWTARSMSRYEDAVGYYQKALALRPDADAVRLALAEIEVALGRFADARPRFEDLRARQPNDPSVQFGLARSLAGLGRKDEAAKLLDRLLADHPDDWKALAERGWVAVELDRATEGERFLRRAEAIAPPDLPLLTRLADCLGLVGKSDEARAYREKADRLKADFRRAEQLGDAIRAQRSDDPGPRYELAQILWRIGKKEDALHWYETALAKDPGHRPTHAALAACFAELGDPARAEWHRRLAGPGAGP